MQNRGPWIAFLTMCFLLTGLVGLFATYATVIPLERGLHRIALLDQVLATGHLDPAAIDPIMGEVVAKIIDTQGDLADRIIRARALVRTQTADDASFVAGRIRAMVIVVTLISAFVGAGILLLASRPAQRP